MRRPEACRRAFRGVLECAVSKADRYEGRKSGFPRVSMRDPKFGTLRSPLGRPCATQNSVLAASGRLGRRVNASKCFTTLQSGSKTMQRLRKTAQKTQKSRAGTLQITQVAISQRMGRLFQRDKGEARVFLCGGSRSVEQRSSIAPKSRKVWLTRK